ncbi:MAG TPA: PilN domain-containing protein [Rhodopila sp.]
MTLGAAARLAARMPVLLRPPPEQVLEKLQVVPAVPRRDLDQLLRHELARITPFSAADLFWRWDSRPKTGDRSRMTVALTMVPKIAVAPALGLLAEAGIRPSFIEAGPTQRPRLLSIEDATTQPGSLLTLRSLGRICAGFALVAVVLPFALQELALHATNNAIDALQPQIRQVEALRRGLTANDAGQALLERETQRTGDVLQVLATVTRILPDDTYLTEFSLRDRQIVLSGRSAAAARLITGLSTDPTIRDAAFAAPVTRTAAAAADVFSIRADVAQ